MKKNSSNLKRLFQYILTYKKEYFIALVSSLLLSILTLLLPKLMQKLIDEHLSLFVNPAISALIKKEHFVLALRLAALFLILVILRTCLSLLYSYMTKKAGAKIVYDMRSDIYKKIMTLPISYFDKNPSGSIVTRVTNDTASVLDLFSYVVTDLFMSFINLTAILIMMFILSPKLASIMLLALPVILILSIIFQKKLRKIYDRQREIRSSLNTRLSENISGMSLIQTFHKEGTFNDKFKELNKSYAGEQIREVRFFSIYRPGMEIIKTSVLVTILWFGGLGHLKGTISIGLLYAFVEYIDSFFFPIFQMVDMVNVLQSAMASADRIFKLLDEEEEDKGGGTLINKKDFKGAIEFKNVYFRYNKEEDADWIIEDLSFKVEAGHFVAFVGATGAGKSTILSLLAGFYKPDKGKILVDGLDIWDHDIRDLRKHLGIVQQDVFLFRGSIMSNISLGSPEVSRKDAIRAAKLVKAHDFIEQLPDSYDSQVLERGQTLSAGQRQLISFARTVATDPPLLILDEATANIDTKTEQLIQEAINQMSLNRTMLVVAHRISTVAHADHIIVMQHGRKAEEGSPQELIEKDGLFRVLYELQYKGDIK